MRGRLLLATLLVAGATTPAVAQSSYDFNVRYFGGGTASLAPGSDDPNSTTLHVGDDFAWTIAAQDGGFWTAQSTVNYFPFMAFSTGVSGDRLGNYELWLYNDGVVQLHSVASNVVNQYAHLGTNSVFLGAGLTWDTMVLFYTLIDATTYDQLFNPDAPEIDTPLSGMLPWQGAPEAGYGVTYTVGTPGEVVPEPATVTLLATGLAALGATRRRKRTSA